MAEKFYQIVFSGEIQPDADLQTVKQKLAKVFNADDARLAYMFSGKPVVIKRRADEITMIKFRAAFQRAGAICKIVELADQTQTTVSATEPDKHTGYSSKYPESDKIPPALLTTPLAVSGHQIEDLAADLAPVGSQILPEYVEPPEPDIDISGIEVAPVGVRLSPAKDQATPPLPDVSDLSLLQ